MAAGSASSFPNVSRRWPISLGGYQVPTPRVTDTFCGGFPPRSPQTASPLAMAPSVPPNGPRDPSWRLSPCRRRSGWLLLAIVTTAAASISVLLLGAEAAPPTEWGATVLRINTGSTDAGSDGWTPDAWFTGGHVSSVASTTPIARTSDDAVLRTARYGRSFSYNVPMRPGVRASVAVMAAETWTPSFGVGRRVYDVLMGPDWGNLKVVHKGVDVYRRVGRRASLYLYTPPVTVGAEGRLVVSFRSVRGDAIVSGLIVKVEGGRVPEGLPLAPAPTAAPGAPHLAHAVTGGPYAEYDYTGDGQTTVRLDGRGSHSHWDGRTKRTGKLVSYLWSNRRNGQVLCRAPVCAMRFPLGVTPIMLTVRDSLGAVSSTATKVTVSDSVTPGLWCTFQKGPARGAAAPPPVWARLSRPSASWARRVTSVNLWRLPVPFADGAVGVRCTGYFVAEAAKAHTFRLLAAGGVALAVGGKQVVYAPGTPGPARLHSANVFLKPGRHPLLLTYAKAAGGSSRLRLGVDAATPHLWRSLLYRDGTVAPTIHYLSVSAGRAYDVIKISGAAFRRGEAAYFNNVKAATVDDDTGNNTPATMYVRVPPGVAGTVTVTVRSANGRSTNGVPFRIRTATERGDTTPRYVPAAPMRVRGGQPWAVKSVSTAAYGPDGRLYLGTLAQGIIVANVDHASNTMRSWCGSGPVGPHRTILGLAFNPADWVAGAAVRVHVTTSTLYWGRDGRLPKHSGWHNGAVEAFVAVTPWGPGKSKCLKKAATVVSGLPVSDHDHSVNGLAFTTSGDLLIQVGGTTNAGVPAKAFENLPESVLSAASLIARTSKGAAFNGAITYSTSNPATAVQTGGRDVSVFASGLRNSFTVLPHSNGQIYATDNGRSRVLWFFLARCLTVAARKGGQSVERFWWGSIGIAHPACGRPWPRRRLGEVGECDTDLAALMFGGCTSAVLPRAFYDSSLAPGAAKVLTLALDGCARRALPLPMMGWVSIPTSCCCSRAALFTGIPTWRASSVRTFRPPRNRRWPPPP